MRDITNICTNCHAVTYGNDGWRHKRGYSSIRFCSVCGKAMDTYRTSWLVKEWVENKKELHERWLKEHA